MLFVIVDIARPGRTVEDILREVQEIEDKQREENRGFDLQPASQATHDQSGESHDNGQRSYTQCE